MFSPSKRKEYTDQVALNIEKMGNKPHRKLFVNEYAEQNRFGEPLYRIDQQDLKWKQKRMQYQANQQQLIQTFSPKKRSKSQLLYDPQMSDFVSATDRQHFLQKNSVHHFPKKKQIRDRLNESCQNVFATNSSTKNKINNLNASVTFWNKPQRSVSPYRNRTSSTILDSFCHEEGSAQHNKSSHNHNHSQSHNNSHNQSGYINPNYINRYKNTNVILGFNDSSPQQPEKGIRTFHDQIPCDTNILHLVGKTSQTGFTHNISYQANDRSRENSQTNARVFNLGSEITPSFHQRGIKTFFQGPTESGKGLPNPVTGQNMKKEKGTGIRMVNTSMKKQPNLFDSIYNSMSEFSPEKNIGIKCHINNNIQKFNPIVMFDPTDPNQQQQLQQQQQPTSARLGKKVFNSKQSPSPVKYLLQQTNETPQKATKSSIPTTQSNPIVNNADHINSQSGQGLNSSIRMPKKLIDTFPKGNQPSQSNYLVYQNSSMYMDKFKDLNEKNSKGNLGHRNKSPNMSDIMQSESVQKHSILTSTNKHNININNSNTMNVNNSPNINTNNNAQCSNGSATIQSGQDNGDQNESVSGKRQSINNQQENKSVISMRKSSQMSLQQQSQQQQQQQLDKSQQQQINQSSQMSVSSKMSQKNNSDNAFSLQQSQSNINFSHSKQGVKMGEISGVKKIYDFESFKNKYR